MKVIQRVTWENDVYPCWCRSSYGAARPNSDVWGKLPPDIEWFEAQIMDVDIIKLYLIGSYDLYETFGSYQICKIERTQDGTDPSDHRSRIRSIINQLRKGRSFEHLIVVSEFDTGPFVVIDGNHRALAYHWEARLEGVLVYLGTKSDLFSSYCWAHPAKVSDYDRLQQRD